MRAAVTVADTIDVDADALQAEPHIELVKQADHLSIDSRIAITESLTAKLVMLSEPSGLWFFTAKEGAEVKHSDGLWQFVQAMFQVSTHDSSSAFRSQGDVGTIALFVSTIIKAIHFVFDDIGSLADGAVKNAGLFQDRRLNTMIAIQARYLGNRLFNKVPVRLIFWQDISKALQRFILFRHMRSSFSST